MKILAWKGVLKLAVVCLVLALAMTGCNNDSDENTTSSYTQTLSYNLTNTTNNTTLSNLELSFLFDVTNQSQNFSVAVTDASGRNIAGYKDGNAYQNNIALVPTSGIVPLSISISNLSNSSNSTATMTVIAHGQGFFSNSQRFDLAQNTIVGVSWIEVTPKDSVDDVATSFAEQNLTLSGSTISSTIKIATPIKAAATSGGNILDGASASLTIPAGTSLLGENGTTFEPVGTVIASVMVFSADPKMVANTSNNPLYLFPGGLSPESLTGDLPAGVEASGTTFLSAGFVAIELVDSVGNQVSGFQGGNVELSFEVPKSTTNPETGVALSINDLSIPLWSYTDSTGIWRYEGDAPIVGENTNTFTISKEIKHLSYYNLDWYRSNRCKLEVDVVDLNGNPNNQKLRLSFAKEGGGWAYKPSGWGPNPEKLEINRVPAFAGHFDLLDNQGNSLLASVEVDGQITEVADGENGLNLADFCFGVSTDSTKSLKATLNVTNPPRISLQPNLTLVCPLNSDNTQTATSGRFYLYSGYSYETSGELTSDALALDNLVEDALYRLYYYGDQTWGQVEFTATDGLSNIQLISLSPCDKVDQTINTRLVCLDDQQTVVRYKAAPLANYWMYNRDYSQYLWGTVNEEGTIQESRAVDTVQYQGSAYVRLDDRYYWGTRKTVTANESQPIEFDISLPSDHAFCTEELTIDYNNTSMSASSLSELADGSSTITITVQERDQFGTARTENSGELKLTATPDLGVSITDPQSNGDGTYTALISSSKVQSVSITGAIDSNALTASVALSFTPVVDIANSTWSLSQSSAAADGTTSLTATLQLIDTEGNNYTSSAGTLALTLPANLSASPVTDHQDGTYSFSMTSVTAENYEIEATLQATSITQKVSVSFTAAIDLSSSTVEANVDTVDADGSSVSTITVTLKDYAGNAFIPSSESVTITPSGSASSSAVHDSGNGIYTSNVTSTNSGTESFTAKLGSQTLGSTSIEFIPVFSVSNSSFSLSSQSIDADGSTASIATVVLRDYANELFVPSSGGATLSHTGTATVPTLSHDGNGTYTSSITSTTAGNVSITASYSSQDINTLSITFNNTGASADTSTVALAVSAMDIDDSTTVTVTLKDASNQSYGQSGGLLSLDSTPSGLSFTNVTDNNDGSYSASISASSVGSYTVLADVGGLTLTASPSIAITQVDATATSLSADNLSQNVGASTNITLSVRQSDNSLVGHGNHNVSVTGFIIDLGLISVQTTDNDDGTYTIGVTCVSGYAVAQSIDVSVDSVNVDSLSVICNNI
ncbi:Ig-like domain-containing protein [Vibrio mediterranei]|uniref:Big-1 domain-containing protein n=1 Tax=Vibrio mediterranei TaxID=689 RepID=A0AAN1FM98_9VIBR|nr:Ig-like domain-containing protein [Vibrio mediterranei]ASI91539.1 hypothetical protein BSZ05_16935 [Vibrio mediterranei]ASI93257.1 hypothetical protein BSZ05_26345 [Vibrio mediterranei]